MQAKLLVSWYCDPSYIPPFRLANRQVTVGPKVGSGSSVYDAFTPLGGGTYDLPAVLQSQGIQGPFDAVVVWSDASLTNLPVNLDAFECPKVLCVGDTHHLDRPLQKMISYAVEGKFDFVLSSHNRQHIHWFKEAGVPNVAWIPAIKAQHVPRPIQERSRVIGFVGQAGKFHPRRLQLLNSIREAGLPLVARGATREQAADLYASSTLSFNASLNGDLNLRNFEVLSAGGCLVTDRLHVESGLTFLFEEGREYVAYDSGQELAEKVRYYLGHPKEALAIAKAGEAAYVERYLPERQAERLWDWVFRGRLPELNGMTWDCRPQIAAMDPVPLGLRIQLYEHIQAAHLSMEQVRVLIAPETPLCIAADLVDLRRVHCCLLDCSVSKRQMLDRFGLQERVSFLSFDEAVAEGNWHFIIAGAAHPVQQIPHYKLVLLPSAQDRPNAA